MRDFRRRQRQKQIASHELVKAREELLSGATYMEATSKNEKPEHDLGASPVVVSSISTEPILNPQTPLNACTSDPFNAYPVYNNARGQQLLSHCK